MLAAKVTSSDITFAIEETGQQEQLTIFTDMIMVNMQQAQQLLKQQIVVAQLYLIQVFMY